MIYSLDIQSSKEQVMGAMTATSKQNRPDLTLVTLIHQSLRADAARLAAALAAIGPGDRPSRVSAISAFYGQYREQLALHHRHEDKLFFPALAARAGADAMHLGELTAQHDELDGALAAVSHRLAALADPAGDFAADREAASSALAAMTALLAAHLALEERHALPLFETEMPAGQCKQLEARARKDTTRAQARFLIPWVVAHASTDQRLALFRSAPPLRLAYRLNLRHYRRLDQALTRTT
jgi:hemerythrin-like domain-containing protein